MTDSSSVNPAAVKRRQYLLLAGIAAFIAGATLLSLVYANRKAEALLSVINNLNVSLDGMVRAICQAYPLFGDALPMPLQENNAQFFNSRIRRNRDLVLFDQRGTLYSKPNLFCQELFDVHILHRRREKEQWRPTHPLQGSVYDRKPVGYVVDHVEPFLLISSIIWSRCWRTASSPIASDAILK